MDAKPQPRLLTASDRLELAVGALRARLTCVRAACRDLGVYHHACSVARAYDVDELLDRQEDK